MPSTMAWKIDREAAGSSAGAMVDGTMRAVQGRGRSKWWPTTTPWRRRGQERPTGRRSRASPRRPRRGLGHVGVAAGAGAEVVGAREVGGPVVEVAQRRLGVEHLDGVDEAGLDQLDERGFGEVAAHRVERVGDVDHAALVADAPAASSGDTPKGTRSVRNSPMISPAWVRSSSPTMTRHGSRSASSSAPRMALWSVMHSTSIPHSTTASSSSSGVVVESPDHIVWLWRSTRTQPGRQRRGEVRMPVDRHGQRSGHPGEGTFRRRGPGHHHGSRWLLGPRGGAVRRRRRLGRDGGRRATDASEAPPSGQPSTCATNGPWGNCRLGSAGSHDPCGLPAQRAGRGERDRRRLGGRRGSGCGGGGPARPRVDRPRLRRAGRPLHRSRTPSPVDDYGRWKAEAEAVVVGACPDAVVVRPSLLYGTG